METKHCDNMFNEVVGSAKIQPQQRAFTLIELLVVVAIISLLVSVMLPSLRTAMDSARAVVCLSNLKQLHLATEYYREDYKSYPFSYYNNGTTAYIWDTLIAPYYDNDPKIDHCPADIDQAENALSYAINMTSFPGGISSYPIAEIDNNVVLYLDASHGSMILITPNISSRWDDYLGWGMTGYALRHHEKFNLIYTDGSTEASDNLNATWNDGLAWR